MTKQLKKAICFFVTVDVYEQLHQVARDRDISVSHLLRQLVREFLTSQGGREDWRRINLTTGGNENG